MIKLSELSEKELMEYMKLYSKCNLTQKNKIFFLTLKNHLMFLKKVSLKLYGENYKYLKQLLNNLDSKKIIEEIRKENSILTDKNSCNSIEEILHMIKKYDNMYDDNYKKSLAINSTLYENNICPLIFYSFGKWIDLKNLNEKELRNIIEFSIMSLYKVIYAKMQYPKEQELEDKGSVSKIFLVSKPNKQKMIYKIPKSLASEEILAQQEYDIYKELIGTEMQEFIAENYLFDEKKKIISHEFVEGKDGEYYLFNHIKLTEEQKKSLKRFYDVYSKRKRKDIILDIHPGNFVWSEKRKKWIIIDLGAIPEIGSDYYKFEQFDEYYDFVWNKREEMMKKVPIRSMDFCVDLEVK